MERGQPEHLGRAGSIWLHGVMQVHPLETLEQPAQGGASGGFAQLVGDGVLARGQALAHPAETSRSCRCDFCWWRDKPEVFPARSADVFLAATRTQENG